MSNIATLKERVLQAEAERDYLASLVNAFFTGEVPDGADFNHFIMAQWGRKRIAEKKQTPVLLSGNPKD